MTRRHVENEVPEAIEFLGACYRDGDYGLVKSGKRAAKLFKRAVELGNVDAMTNLGSLYDEGNGVKRDPRKANQLFRMASDRGNVMAQFNLAQNLRIGDGVQAPDRTEAKHWFERAAAQGYAVAQFNLAVMLDEEQNVDESFRYYKLAAERGHIVSQFNVGICYEYGGEGVDIDLAEAMTWYALAAEQGDESAQEALDGVRAKIRLREHP